MSADRCPKCGKPNDNGEGWDGLCGTCADHAEMVPCGVCKEPAQPTVTPRCDRCFSLEVAISAAPHLAAKILGRIFGSVPSSKRSAAARGNGKLGGRPVLPPGVKGKYERRTA